MRISEVFLLTVKEDYIALLEEIAKSEARIRAVLLTDLAGVLKHAVERSSSTSTIASSDQLHAFLGYAIAQGVAEMGSKQELNELHTVIVEYQQGSLILAPINSGVIIVLTESGSNLGLIRYKLASVAKKLFTLESTLIPTQQPDHNTHPHEITTSYTSTQEIETPLTSSGNREDLPEEDAILLALDALDNM